MLSTCAAGSDGVNPDHPSQGQAETAVLPGSYRRCDGIARLFFAACQPTAKPARLLTGELFLAFVRLRLLDGWFISLKGRDGLV
jgi:hypothetical protein